MQRKQSQKKYYSDFVITVFEEKLKKREIVITHTFASEYPKLTENYTLSLSPPLNFTQTHLTTQKTKPYFLFLTHTLSLSPILFHSLPIHSPTPNLNQTNFSIFFFSLFAFCDKVSGCYLSNVDVLLPQLITASPLGLVASLFVSRFSLR